MRLLNRLSRITTAGRTFIPQIDGLRFVAIMSVIAYHVRAICSFHLHASASGDAVEGDLVNDVFSVGSCGVELFFAISGFILSLPFARAWLGGERPVSLGRYYLRRVTRIEPPYIIHLAFLFLLCALVLRHQPTHQQYFHGAGWLPYSLKHILASLFYSNGFIFANHPYPNIVLWSLEVEVQFYLLAPLLARLFQISNVWLRRGLLLAAIGLLPLIGTPVAKWLGHPYLGHFSLLAGLHFFLIGFLLADWQVTAKTPARHRVLWDLVGVLAAAALVWFRHASWLGSALPVIIGLGCIAAFSGKFVFRILGNPWITTIGGMCYTIYMYHWLMISMLIRPLIHLQTHVLWLDLLIEFVLMSGIIIAVSAVLFALFERPFMRRDWPARSWEKFQEIFRLRSPAGANTPT